MAKARASKPIKGRVENYPASPFIYLRYERLLAMTQERIDNSQQLAFLQNEPPTKKGKRAAIPIFLYRTLFFY
jgi:hypothetical protein